jgi:flagellar hook-associated protein 3 FlgL
MIAVRNALTANDPNALATASTALNNAGDTLSTAAADNGAVQLRIQSEQTQEQSTATEVSSLISSQTSANLPQTITQLNQAQIAYQAAMETAVKVMQLSLTQYIQ